MNEHKTESSTDLTIGTTSHANYLLKIAVKAAFRDESETVTAIIFATCALETFINEVHEDVKNTTTKWDKVKGLENEYLFMELMGDKEEWLHTSLIKKYLVAKRLMTQEPYDKSKRQYANLDMLISLRNAIIHLKPISIKKSGSKGEAVHSHKGLIGGLVANNLIPPVDVESDELINWLAMIQGEKVATWACVTAHDIINEFINSIKNEPYKTIIKMLTGELVNPKIREATENA